MALRLRSVVAQLLGSDTAAAVEPADRLVALAPARPVRRGIPDEYLERHQDAYPSMSGRNAATRILPAASSPPRDLVRAPSHTPSSLPYLPTQHPAARPADTDH
jgi:hypothetical protein